MFDELSEQNKFVQKLCERARDEATIKEIQEILVKYTNIYTGSIHSDNEKDLCKIQ